MSWIFGRSRSMRQTTPRSKQPMQASSGEVNCRDSVEELVKSALPNAPTLRPFPNRGKCDAIGRLRLRTKALLRLPARTRSLASGSCTNHTLCVWYSSVQLIVQRQWADVACRCLVRQDVESRSTLERSLAFAKPTCAPDANFRLNSAILKALRKLHFQPANSSR